MKPLVPFLRVLAGSLLGLLSLACGSDKEVLSVDGEAVGAECAPFVLKPPAELFDWETVPTFELSLPAERYEWLNEHALDEQYVEARLSFEGQDVGPVGLRFKGDHGTLGLCVGEDGELLCAKLSMKLDFAQAYPGCRFYGTRKLNLHSMQWDATKLHERLAYDLYRQADVPAPRSAWANVSVNGVSLGIFSMVENVDQSFVDGAWPAENDGDLYKEAWPKTSLPNYYRALLETDSERADVGSFVEFYEDLAEATPNAAALSRVLEEHTDRAALERYLAVDDALVNWDGVTTFYTASDDSWTRNHNYFWYRRPSDGRFVLIPWDLDGTLAIDKSIAEAPRWTEVPANCSQKYVEFGGEGLVFAPGCDPIFRGMAANRDGYLAMLDELLAQAFSVDALRERVEQWARAIDASVAQDPRSNYATWTRAVEKLTAELPLLHDRLERLRDGRSVKPLELVLAQNDFESTDDFAVATGVRGTANSTSTSDVSLLPCGETGTSVTQCVRLDFDLHNETTSWQQWAKASLSLVGGVADVSSYQGLRVRARADRPRRLSVQLASPLQTRASDGIQNGWEALPLTTEFEEYALRFADAAIPSWADAQATDAGAPLASVLTQVAGLEFLPQCALCAGDGFIPDSGEDAGFLELDFVSFF